jgi:hypothetical protein
MNLSAVNITDKGAIVISTEHANIQSCSDTKIQSQTHNSKDVLSNPTPFFRQEPERKTIDDLVLSDETKADIKILDTETQINNEPFTSVKPSNQQSNEL